MPNTVQASGDPTGKKTDLICAFMEFTTEQGREVLNESLGELFQDICGEN